MARVDDAGGGARQGGTAVSAGGDRAAWVGLTRRCFGDERGECVLDRRRWQRAADRAAETNLRRPVPDYEQRHDSRESREFGSFAGFGILPERSRRRAGGRDGASIAVFSVRGAR